MHLFYNIVFLIIVNQNYYILLFMIINKEKINKMKDYKNLLDLF